MTVPDCRSCGGPLQRMFVDLGDQPLANSYLSGPDAIRDERRYPLYVRVCDQCLLVQADEVIPAHEIFSDYAYFSSYSETWVEHARVFSEMACARFAIDERSRVVEVASNDGYLLRHFVARGVPVLGIEPAANVAAVAQAAGVATEVRFFGRQTARELVARGVHADLLVANNVMAHVPDLGDFIAGMAILLAPGGVVSIEVAHVLALIQGCEFDTMYHEHYSYYSLVACEAALARHGLRVFDVEMLPTHGGSLRILAVHAGDSRAAEPGLEEARRVEREAGLHDIATYAGFHTRVRCRAHSVRRFLRECGEQGRTVVGYGAAAKGNTLLNYCGVTPADLAYVADRNPHKQATLLPGSHIPVVSPDHILRDRPDFVLLLAWNLADEIMDQLSEVRSWNGRFVTTMPSLRVLS